MASVITVRVLLQFAELMDPSYVIVDFRGGDVPANYRAALDHINASIGGAAEGASGPDSFNVVPGGNQPIMFMDPKGNNLNLLHVDSKIHAEHVAQQLLALCGVSSWVWKPRSLPLTANVKPALP
jgi:hypothetical protein